MFGEEIIILLSTNLTQEYYSELSAIIIDVETFAFFHESCEKNLNAINSLYKRMNPIQWQSVNFFERNEELQISIDDIQLGGIFERQAVRHFRGIDV